MLSKSNILNKCLWHSIHFSEAIVTLVSYVPTLPCLDCKPALLHHCRLHKIFQSRCSMVQGSFDMMRLPKQLSERNFHLGTKCLRTEKRSPLSAVLFGRYSNMLIECFAPINGRVVWPCVCIYVKSPWHQNWSSWSLLRINEPSSSRNVPLSCWLMITVSL